MAWKTDSGLYSKQKPIRVRLSNGYTKTSEEVTDKLLAELGWYEFQETEVTELPIATPQIDISTLTNTIVI